MRPTLTALIIFLLAVSFKASAQDTKLYVVTHIDLTPNYIAEGTPLLKQFAAESRKDKGVVRFEMLVDVSRKNHFTVVSIWDNQAAFDAHIEAAHTKQMREKLQPMLGSPFDERFSVPLQ
jgi:quinol monooxygenase YgiN